MAVAAGRNKRTNNVQFVPLIVEFSKRKILAATKTSATKNKILFFICLVV